MEDKIALLGMTLAELKAVAGEIGMPSFAARQMAEWLYGKKVASIDEMTNISAKNRRLLNERYTVGCAAPVDGQRSADGTVKYLYRTAAGGYVETVYIPDGDRATLCVSSQVGCRMNCRFCMTGKQGFSGQLTAADILNQLYSLPERETLTNVVFMGQGEPLLNLDNVLKAMEMLNESFQIGARRLTVSTSGIIPQIKKLAELDMQSTLALSLHAPNHEIRKQLMQIENKYPMDELHEALKYYVDKTGRRITIEYLLIKGLNDTISSAKQLAAYLKDIKCNINLIPYNPTAKNDYKRPDNNSIMKFKALMEHSGKKVTVRLERGADIDAACGQLSGKAKKEEI